MGWSGAMLLSEPNLPFLHQFPSQRTALCKLRFPRAPLPKASGGDESMGGLGRNLRDGTWDSPISPNFPLLLSPLEVTACLPSCDSSSLQRASLLPGFCASASSLCSSRLPSVAHLLIASLGPSSTSETRPHSNLPALSTGTLFLWLGPDWFSGEAWINTWIRSKIQICTVLTQSSASWRPSDKCATTTFITRYLYFLFPLEKEGPGCGTSVNAT